MNASQTALVTAIVSAFVASAAQYLGIAKPALETVDVVERQLERREAQISRRELRVNALEDELEVCVGRPIARGATPALAARAAASVDMLEGELSP